MEGGWMVESGLNKLSFKALRHKNYECVSGWVDGERGWIRKDKWVDGWVSG